MRAGTRGHRLPRLLGRGAGVDSAVGGWRGGSGAAMLPVLACLACRQEEEAALNAVPRDRRRCRVTGAGAVTGAGHRQGPRGQTGWFVGPASDRRSCRRGITSRQPPAAGSLRSSLHRAHSTRGGSGRRSEAAAGALPSPRRHRRSRPHSAAAQLAGQSRPRPAVRRLERGCSAVGSTLSSPTTFFYFTSRRSLHLGLTLFA